MDDKLLIMYVGYGITKSHLPFEIKGYVSFPILENNKFCIIKNDKAYININIIEDTFIYDMISKTYLNIVLCEEHTSLTKIPDREQIKQLFKNELNSKNINLLPYFRKNKINKILRINQE